MQSAFKFATESDYCKVFVIYEFSCRCDATYAGRTSKRLGDSIKQHVPTNICLHNFWQREQPPRGSKQQPNLKHDSAIGQHLLDNPTCAQNYSEDCFTIIGKARSFLT